MPPIKSILKSHRVRRAGRKRKCYHSSSHEINKGDFVLEIRSDMNWPGYCLACADKIISKASKDLETIRKQIDEQVL